MNRALMAIATEAIRSSRIGNHLFLKTRHNQARKRCRPRHSPPRPTERDHFLPSPNMPRRSGRNSLMIFEPAFAPIEIPKLLAPSAGELSVLGCQVRDIKAEPAVLPRREYEKASLPSSWRARTLLASAYLVRAQIPCFPDWK